MSTAAEAIQQASAAVGIMACPEANPVANRASKESPAPATSRGLTDRAGKGWLYEGGIKIPQLIKVPGILKNTKIYDLTVSHDLFPTILDFSGIKYNIEVDGISLKPIIENKDKTKREEIFWYYPHYHGSLWKPGSAIRYKNWKLVLHYETESSELFDLEDDPGELNDLSLEFPQIKNNLLNKIDKIIKETDAKLVSKNENYIID